ncbi:aldo/keto reductase, partial [Staphylococcus epidermidis]|uniref:aldo/keto reductase n=1 Tax=Staphylococcus epidermidis TaxID=1282 RepID=UPI0037DA3BAB
MLIPTKLPNPLTHHPHITSHPSKKHIKQTLNPSFKPLPLNHLHLYQLHPPTIHHPLHQTITAFHELKQQPYIPPYPISSIPPNLIHYYLKNTQIQTLISHFNLIHNPPQTLINHLHHNQLKILPPGPLFKALLTSK